MVSYVRHMSVMVSYVRHMSVTVSYVRHMSVMVSYVRHMSVTHLMAAVSVSLTPQSVFNILTNDAKYIHIKQL
jgi:hypothetical protein